MPRVETKPVSVRVPVNLPDEVRAITGMPFSKAVTVILTSFVDAQRQRLASSTPAAQEPNND